MDYHFKNKIMKNLSLTEIKKLTYKQQPKAKFERIRMGVAYYSFSVLFEGETSCRLGFECIIPISDMGEADFTSEMEAKHLLRWATDTVLNFQPIKEEL